MIILSSWCSKPCMTLFLLCGDLFLQVMVWLWRSLIWNHMITGVDGWCPPQLIMWRSRKTAQSQVRWASPHILQSSSRSVLFISSKNTWSCKKLFSTMKLARSDHHVSEWKHHSILLWQVIQWKLKELIKLQWSRNTNLLNKVVLEVAKFFKIIY